MGTSPRWLPGVAAAADRRPGVVPPRIAEGAVRRPRRQAGDRRSWSSASPPSPSGTPATRPGRLALLVFSVVVNALADMPFDPRSGRATTDPATSGPGRRSSVDCCACDRSVNGALHSAGGTGAAESPRQGPPTGAGVAAEAALPDPNRRVDVHDLATSRRSSTWPPTTPAATSTTAGHPQAPCR